jgi:hypothetical protein
MCPPLGFDILNIVPLQYSMEGRGIVLGIKIPLRRLAILYFALVLETPVRNAHEHFAQV